MIFVRGAKASRQTPPGLVVKHLLGVFLRHGFDRVFRLSKDLMLDTSGNRDTRRGHPCQTPDPVDPGLCREGEDVRELVLLEQLVHRLRVVEIHIQCQNALRLERLGGV